MIMTPVEMIEFHGRNFENLYRTLNEYLKIKNYDLFIETCAKAFEEKLMQGLISWRIGIENPKGLISQAVAVANEAITIVEDHNVLINFPVEKAMILSYLLGEKIAECNYDISDLNFQRALDFQLARSLQGIRNKNDWDDILLKNKSKRANKLIIKTYITYKELIFSKNKRNEELLMNKALDLFVKRRYDTFYSKLSLTDGGELSNAITVDYRLSALLKYVSCEFSYIHSWKWN